MRKYQLVTSLCICMLVLSSCEFKCKVGAMDDEKPVKKATGPVKIGDALIYNNIDLTIKDVKLKKAYLVFEKGERVPEDNFVDFKTPVKLLLLIDSGWTVSNKKVLLGASEKVFSEGGEVMLNMDDLFSKYPEGVSEEDAKIIGLSVNVRLTEGSPPTSFDVHFKVWDKNSDAYLEGKYKLFSK